MNYALLKHLLVIL